jgi:hypothetical protein
MQALFIVYTETQIIVSELFHIVMFLTAGNSFGSDLRKERLGLSILRRAFGDSMKDVFIQDNYTATR